MPRYFFDITDADNATIDEIGLEFENIDAAIADARRAILEMASDTLIDARRSCIAICIRDGKEGPVVITVTVSSTTDADA